ncbi:MAG: hydrogenase maturation protease [Gammaproteobacteria bacterium]|uniref:hydrogenase maturation protease n=1 Tax=Fulvivirga sp. TaxID=1931237 RepID=UPI0032EF6A5D
MLTIIGCGNANRSDDAVGIVVAQSLNSYLDKNPNNNVNIFDAGTSGMDVMFMARGCEQLIIVDASSTGSDPGAIYEVPGEELENIPAPSYNLHDFRWDNALYAGRKIFKENFPKKVNVYLIEAESLEFGLDLSKSVNQSADIVIDKIITIINNYEHV